MYEHVISCQKKLHNHYFQQCSAIIDWQTVIQSTVILSIYPSFIYFMNCRINFENRERKQIIMVLKLLENNSILCYVSYIFLCHMLYYKKLMSWKLRAYLLEPLQVRIEYPPLRHCGRRQRKSYYVASQKLQIRNSEISPLNNGL